MLRLRLMANDDKEVCKGDTIIGTAPAGREKLFLTGHKGGSSSVAKAGRLGSYNRATEGHTQELFRARLEACGYSTHAGGESGGLVRMLCQSEAGCGPAATERTELN